VDRGNFNLYENCITGTIKHFVSSIVELLDRLAKNQHVKRKKSINFVSKNILYFIFDCIRKLESQ